MYPQLKEIGRVYANIRSDPKVNVWHISLYTCLLDLWIENNFKMQINVNRKSLMAKAHFKSITTYHKCISQLEDLGYITYQPTYDIYKGSTIGLIFKGKLPYSS